MRFFIALCIAVCVASNAPAAFAQNYSSLFREFDARDLTSDDKRFLQAALAFEGYYNGLLDGAWGSRSQSALDDFAQREFSARSNDLHMAYLALKLLARQEIEGWDVRYFESMGMSILLPNDELIVDPPSDHFANYGHRNSSLSISMGRLSKETAQSIHDSTVGVNSGSSVPYTVRKQNVAISSATKSDGSTLYTRSNFINGDWSTIIVSAENWNAGILNAVTASITAGPARSLTITPGGHLANAVSEAMRLASEEEERENAPGTNAVASPPKSSKPSRNSGGSSGTGFHVSADGYVVTNAHVVDDCTSISVDGLPAMMVDSSETFDLAILKTSPSKTGTYANFSDEPARLNSDVTAVGYPYAGFLSGINVTRGSVSSMKGMTGDSVTMQITAPVQSGNSGGPLLAADGSVVGIVVSKLDAVKFSELSGDFPQNVNFAVRGELAQLFLAQNGVTAETRQDAVPLAPEDLADKAKAFTTFIECN